LEDEFVETVTDSRQTFFERLLTACFCREEKRCRVREKELREKDILIQDNLIRFSTHLSQADNKKT